MAQDPIQEIRDQAEQTAQNIQHLSSRLSEERKTLGELVESYRLARITLLEERMREHKMTWCTRCTKSILENETQLIFIDETRERSGGYGNSEYWFENQLALHRVCSSCRELFANHHGWKGKYDRQSNNQAYFYAFKAEKREGGYYAYKFGNWVKIDGKIENFLDQGPFESMAEELAKEMGFLLPPKICLKSDELVIEEEAQTEATQIV